MITEKDLQEAIAECEGERNPNANTCVKLAAFYIIRNHLYGDGRNENLYSFAANPTIQSSHDPGIDKCDINSDSEFAQATRGMDMNEVLYIMDELMTALAVTSPRLYAGVMRKITE